MKYYCFRVFVCLSLTFYIGVMNAESVNSVIVNKSNIKNSSNASKGVIGSAESNQGSVIVNNSRLSNSNIVNNTTIKNSSNVALGGKASQGSIEIRRSLNGVAIVNKANIKGSSNVSIDVLGTGGFLGTKNSQQGSIIFK